MLFALSETPPLLPDARFLSTAELVQGLDPGFLFLGSAPVDEDQSFADNAMTPGAPMDTQSHIRSSLQRACETFDRRPSAARQEDSPAIAVWIGGLGTRLLHPSPTLELSTDLPVVLGGGGSHPSPGWYFRAGVASCMATSIAMEAAQQGVALTRLQVEAHSESDVRGLLGTAGVSSGPLRCWLKVALHSTEASETALRALVVSADRRSPMAQALRHEVAVDLEVTVQLQSVPGA
jgi:uncharacterized OsmC-like protein